MNLIIPENYNPVLSIRETQKAIKYIRDTFQHEFGKEMKVRVNFKRKLLNQYGNAQQIEEITDALNDIRL